VNRLFSVRAQIPKHDPDDRYHECTENTEQERVDHVKKIQYDRETGKRERQHDGEKKNNNALLLEIVDPAEWYLSGQNGQGHRAEEEEFARGDRQGRWQCHRRRRSTTPSIEF
jgi:hypothetical protein